MVDAQEPPTPSPPRTRHTRRRGPTRFEKEAAATGGKSAADQPGDPKVIGPWRIGRTIGKGASGRVKIAKHSRTGQYAAIKIVPKHALLFSSRMSIVDAGSKLDKAVLGIEREIVIMKLIDHPNVMALYDVWETAKELYLVLEYVEGGELFDYLVSQGRLPPDEASRYFQQIVAGVDYCHRFNICHRDLKPENLLLDCDRNIKIADFGMAALEPSDRLLETSCGSPHYASPEIVAGMSYHGAASDIWSCGVILFALLTGRLPFDDENIRLLLQKVKSGRFVMPADLPADARDLITRMLVVDPEKRITMAEINKHPFCQRRQDTDSGRKLHVVEPPRLDQIARPVKSEKEIDRDILRNLRTLWCGSSERAIVRALLTHEKTWEKAFYYLLLQYRNKHLENFNPDPEHYRNSTGDLSESEPRPEDAARRRPRPLSEVKRVALSKENQIPAPKERPPVSSPHRATRPAPKSPNTPSRIGGPRPPSPRPNAKTITSPIRGLARPEPVAKGSAPPPPRIWLQRPTPEPEDGRINSQSRPKGLGLSMPSPTLTTGTTSPGSPSVSPVPGSPLNPMGNIAVPHVQDAALQKFFHDIAEQLQLIGSNSPRSSIIVDNLPSPALSMGDSTTPSTPVSTPVTVPLELPTVIPAGEVSSKPRRPGYECAATESAMSTSEADPAGPIRRRSYLVDTSARENIMADSVNASDRRGRHSLHGGKAGLEQTKRRAKPPPLDLNNSPKAAQAELMLSPTSSPFLGTPSTASAPPSPLVAGPSNEIKQSWFSNLFSWKPAVFTLMSADDCASSRAECIRLLETFGVSVRLEDADGWGILKCRLEDIRDVSGIIIPKPVRFRIEFLPHATWPTATGSLASQTSTVSSVSATATSTRNVGPTGSRTSVNPAGSDNGTTTSMTMVQEKGALSSFKAVYGRLRAEWRLDTLKSPAVVGNSRFATSPLASPALSSDTAQAMWS